MMRDIMMDMMRYITVNIMRNIMVDMMRDTMVDKMSVEIWRKLRSTEVYFVIKLKLYNFFKQA